MLLFLQVALLAQPGKKSHPSIEESRALNDDGISKIQLTITELVIISETGGR